MDLLRHPSSKSANASHSSDSLNSLNPINPLNSFQNDPDTNALNWEDIQWQIPAASEPNHPLELIKNCLNSDSDLDPYDQIDMQFNIYMESLKKRFKELSR
ncbi:MAG TPA: hypothetical protein VGP47_10395 [Parachlamydiaceae bacterium]|nr:hypothetical protein [Parachlamydiaceae bacterium]